MKRCPDCRRDYYDDTLLYCLDDGNALLEGPASAAEPVTALFVSPPLGDSIPDSRDDQKTATPSNRGRETTTGISAREKWLFTTAFAILLLVASVGFVIYKLSVKPETTIHTAKIERLTTNGKASSTAVSPDGKYIIYSVDEGGQQSLWLRQVAASSNVQIIPPSEDVFYWNLTFSPDSNYINFVRAEFEKNVAWSLNQMPVLGGTQKKLLTGVEGGISYSPNGKQFAFIRDEHPTSDESSVIIANADGTGERTLASRRVPETFSARRVAPAWSPDGKTILCLVNDETTVIGEMDVVEVNVEDGSVKPVTTQAWKWIGNLAWLHDRSGFLVVGSDKDATSYSGQIWHYSYPEGRARRITTDFNDYLSISLTADSKALATVQSSTISNIWAGPNDDSGRGQQIKSGGNNEEGMFGLAWTPDGRIVYDSMASGAADIWIMNADGTNHKQLTAQAGQNRHPDVTPDGRFIVFSSLRNDRASIWRMDLEGNNAKQLTTGDVDAFSPRVSPDSRWVIFAAQNFGNTHLWKMPIEGGEAIKLTDKFTNSPDISPDGKWIVCSYRKDENSTWRYAIIPFEGGEPVKVFDLLGKKSDFRWSHDGRSLYYLRDTQSGVTNIWSYPIEGGTPQQVTTFTSDQIYNFARSADGKQLVLVRGTTTSDVVLMRDFW